MIKRELFEAIVDSISIGQEYVVRISKAERPNEGSRTDEVYEIEVHEVSRVSRAAIGTYDVQNVCEEIDKASSTMSTKAHPHKYYRAVGTKKAKDIIRAGIRTEE